MTIANETEARFMLRHAADESNLAFIAKAEGSAVRYEWHQGLYQSAMDAADRLLGFRDTAP